MTDSMVNSVVENPRFFLPACPQSLQIVCIVTDNGMVFKLDLDPADVYGEA
jgi:hypothetical protein